MKTAMTVILLLALTGCQACCDAQGESCAARCEVSHE